MFTGKLIGLAVLAAAFTGGAAAAEPAPDLRARAQAVVDASYPADGPGAAVIVTRHGETIYSAGRGLADVETHRPITPDTVFRLGSITKQFTASVILQLVQEGRISLDDPLSRFLPDYPQPGASATVRQLLNHTSGVQSYTGIRGWMVEANTSRPFTTEQMIAQFRDLPAPTRPGEAWEYNNSGYVLLGAIIEQVTGRPWHQAVAERIAGPLRLRTIGYGVDREGGAAMARGYTSNDGTVAPAQRIHMSVPHAAGALVGTVGDLARWARALHHGRVVSAPMYAAMTSPTALPGGATEPYGFGLRFAEVRGRRTVEHGGGIFGFSTESIYIPSEDVFVAVFANSDSPATAPSTVARRLAALAVGEPYRDFTRAEVDPAALAPLFGVYRVGEGEQAVTRRFYERDGKLYTMRDGGAEQEIQPAGNGEFFYPASFTWFKMVRRPDGTQIMEMHQNGAAEAELATRIGDIPAEAAAFPVPRAVLEAYVGHYETAGPSVDVALGEGGVLTLQLEGQPALPLRAVSETEFTVERVNARIAFHRETGPATGFTISQGGRELEGRRVPR